MNQLKLGDTIAYDKEMIAYRLTTFDFRRFVGKLVLMDDEAVGAETPSWLEVVQIERFNNNGGLTIKTAEGTQTIPKRKLVQNAGNYVAFYAVKEVSAETVPETAVVVSEEYTKAVALTKEAIAHILSAESSLIKAAKILFQVKEEGLYKELGYSNFDDYCDNEVKFKHSQATKLLAVYRRNPNPSRLGEWGIEKTYLLSMLDEPDREEIEQRVDVENTSVKELKAQIKQLKEDKKQLQAEQGEISLRVGLAESQRDEAIKKLESKKAELANAQERIEELENQEPEAVYVEDLGLEQRYQEDVDRMDKEWARRYEEMEQEKDHQIITLKRQHYQKEQEFQQKLEEAQQSGENANCELDAYLKMFQDTLRHITALLGDPSMMGFAKRQAISQLEVTFEKYIGAVKDD